MKQKNTGPNVMVLAKVPVQAKPIVGIPKSDENIGVPNRRFIHFLAGSEVWQWLEVDSPEPLVR